MNHSTTWKRSVLSLFFDNLIRALVLVLYNTSIFVMIFSVFRMRHLKQVHYHIVTAGTILGLTVYFFRFVMHSPYFSSMSVIFLIVLLTTIFRYSILYSFIIGITTYLIYSFLEFAVVLPGLHFGWVTNEQIGSSMALQIFYMLLMTTIMFLISFIFKKTNKGFSFITKKYQNKQVLKKHNFLWCVVLIISSSVTQILSIEIQNATLDIIVVVVFTVVFLATIVYAYMENKKSIRDRYGI